MPKDPNDAYLATDEPTCSCNKPKHVPEPDHDPQSELQEARDVFWAEQEANDVWEVPIGPFAPWLGTCGEPKTGLESAISHAVRGTPPRVPLILDPSDSHPVDTYYAFRSALVLEAKKIVVDGFQGVRSSENIMEDNRKALINAMKYGQTLYIRMANGATDFLDRYTSPTHFPVDVFDQAAVAEIQTVHTETMIDPATGDKRPGDSLWGTAHPFAAALREEDCEHGMFFARRGFEVVVCSHFTAEDYAEFLGTALPLDKLQPVLALLG